MPNVKIDPNDIAIRLKGLKKSFGPQTVHPPWRDDGDYR